MMRRCLKLLLAGMLAVAGVSVTTAPASADCDSRVFAVDSASGHLVEIPLCAGFGTPREVSSEDWRGYTSVFAMRENAMVVLYAVSATGELLWRRQDVPGGALSAPARVGASVRLQQPAVFTPYPGYLVSGGSTYSVDVYRHQGWATGDPEVSTEPPLFTNALGPPITGMGNGLAIGIWGGWVHRIQRAQEPEAAPHDDIWIRQGGLPTGVTGLVNDARSLYGLSASGAVIALGRSPACDCDPFASGRSSWEVRDTAPGTYRRVILPITAATGALPHVNPPVCAMRPVPDECRISSNGLPWEWQVPPSR